MPKCVLFIFTILLSLSCKKELSIRRPYAFLEGDWELLGYSINNAIYSTYGYNREDDRYYNNDSWNCSGYHYEFDSLLNKYVQKKYSFKELFKYSITTRLKGVDTLVLVEKYTSFNSAGTPANWGTTQVFICSRLNSGYLDYKLNDDTTISFYSQEPRFGVGSSGGPKITVYRRFKLRKH